MDIIKELLSAIVVLAMCFLIIYEFLIGMANAGAGVADTTLLLISYITVV